MTVIDRKLTAFKKCFWLFGDVCDKLKVIEKTQAARPALQGGQPVLPILLAVAMAALGYLTQTGKMCIRDSVRVVGGERADELAEVELA